MNLNRIDECVEDVLADLERQGQISLADVQRLVDLHRLDGAETTKVFAELRSRGIHPDGSANDGSQAYQSMHESKSPGKDTVGLMLRAAGRARLLTAEEEKLLGRRIHIGQILTAENPCPPAGSDVARQIADGKLAHEELVLANLRLVVSIARRYRTAGLDLSDLIQEGTIGLMRAADKFDHTLGYRFSTYATWWIRQAIGRGIADKGRLIRLPVHVTENLNRISVTQSQLRSSLGREPKMEEIAFELNADPADISALLDMAREPISIDKSISDSSDTELVTILDLYAADVAEVVLNSITKAEIRGVLSQVAEFQATNGKGATAHAVDMLKLRFGLDDDRERTLEEVGAAYGITRERARQILNKILASPELRVPLTHLTDID